MPQRTNGLFGARALAVVAVACVWMSGHSALAKHKKGHTAERGAHGARGLTVQAGAGRYALVVGVGDYNGAWQRLPNTRNDARAMTRKLEGMGFTVQEVIDPDIDRMTTAVDGFIDTLQGSGGVGVFYYAGHGAQVKGINYLIPSGFIGTRESQVKNHAFSVEDLIEPLEARAHGVSVVILDACRDDGLIRDISRGAGRVRGLAPLDLGGARGLLVEYATAGNEVAYDGAGQHGVFTSALLRNLVPGVPLVESLENVATQVYEETEHFDSGPQIPTHYGGDLLGRFCLAGQCGVAGVAVADNESSDTEDVVPAEAAPAEAEAPAPAPSCPSGATWSAPLGKCQCDPGTEWDQSAGQCGAPRAEATDALSGSGTKIEPKSGLEFVSLPGGTFHYGCEPQDTQCGDDEKPGREVTVSPFWLGKTDVTVAAYAKCVSAGTCTAAPNTGSVCNWGVSGKEGHPINCVDWNQAVAFCAWIGGRLPTAEEWEWAAKGGESRIYPWGNEAPDENRALFGKPYPGDGTAPADSYGSGATKQGLLNMAGNVWQWTASNYDANSKELRGGSWILFPRGLRASLRGRDAPGDGDGGVGFRCGL